MPTTKRKTTPDAVAALTELFRRGGYFRTKDEKTFEKKGTAYHKGNEVRLVLRSKAEVNEARRYLRAVGLKPGKPFLKHEAPVQPVYGADAVEWFRTRIPGARAAPSRARRAASPAEARRRG